MFGRTKKNLLNWLATDNESSAKGAASNAGSTKEAPTTQERPPAAALGQARQSTAAAFEAQLKKAIRDGGSVNAGRVMVMDLEKVRAEFGDDWPRVCESVETKIRGVLERELSPRDFFTVNGVLSYVIVFHSLAAEAAKVRIHAIANLILEKLFGQEKRLNLLRIKSGAHEVDGQLVFEEEEGLAALTRSLDEANGVVADANTVGPRQDTVALPLAVQDEFDEIKCLIERLQGQGAIEFSWDDTSGALESKKETQAPNWVPIIWERVDALCDRCEILAGGDTSLVSLIESELGLLNGLLAAAHDSQKAAQNPVNPAPVNGRGVGTLADSPQNIDVRYEPVWSVQHKAIGIYLCETVFDYGHKVESAQGWIQTETDTRLIAGIDKIGLERVVLKFNESQATDVKHIHGIPVHKSTLADAVSQREFFNIARMTPPEWRGYVVWEIVGVKSHEWSLQLETFADMLRSIGKAVTIRITDNGWGDLRASLRDAKQAGLFGVGIDVSRMTGDEGAIFAKAQQLIEVASATGLRTNFWNVHSRVLAQSIMAAGATYISGEVISAELIASLNPVGEAEIPAPA